MEFFLRFWFFNVALCLSHVIKDQSSKILWLFPSILTISSISILSVLPMVASQSRTDLQGARLKYTKNFQSNERNKVKVINNIITIVKRNFKKYIKKQ